MDIKNSLFSENRNSKEIVSWVNDTYIEQFEPYFSEVKSLFQKMKSQSRPITDSELESILVDVPLAMIEISEKINNFKLEKDVNKLEIKRKRYSSKFECLDQGLSETKAVEVSNIAIIDDEIYGCALSCLIDRVEQEISFSRELIMSAKKIWDGRKATESANPIGPVAFENVSDDLPEYNRYIK